MPGSISLQDPAWLQTGELPAGILAAGGDHPRAPGPAGGQQYPLYRAFLQFILDNGWDSWYNYVDHLWGNADIDRPDLCVRSRRSRPSFWMLMNFTFLYAGSVSSNPTFIVLAVLIIIGWRAAGLVGAGSRSAPLDRHNLGAWTATRTAVPGSGIAATAIVSAAARLHKINITSLHDQPDTINQPLSLRWLADLCAFFSGLTQQVLQRDF